MASEQEKRSTRRFNMRLPLNVKFTNGEVKEHAAETRDVSARGVFFHVDANIEPGARVEFVLTLPPEITLTDSIRVRCSGKIVRVDSEGSGKGVGIAAVIEQYDFLTDEPEPDEH